VTVPHFIFMLTRNDRTLRDARARLQDALTSGVRHIGFKDVGLSTSALRELSSSIRAHGASVYLEVVSLDEASEVASAQVALSLEVDYLLGGTRPEVVLPVIRGSAIKYYPFAGTIVGHPSRLVSSFEDTVANSKALTDIAGVDGIDLLAYRFDGDAAALIADVCAQVAPKRVIVAGSIDRAERIAAVVRGGAAAFTVGTAALDGMFPVVEEGLAHQLRYIELAALRSARELNQIPTI
jgi:4-hydroxythreonine-4-phosphate dehydrogenase